MRLAIRRRHQHADIAADDFGFDVTEQALRGGAEGLDDAALVDHNDCVRHRVEDRTQSRFALAQSKLGSSALADIADDCRQR